ncbi:MAG: Glu-tRNA(Gln) amidotransferase subunit GatE [Candidatus Micrarchaeota archaeon]
MQETDYSKIGLKCGLEVHQQLDTGKLFCRCPGKLHEEEKFDYKIRRRLRPVASELGEYDAAALEAYQKGFSYEYEAFNDCNCPIECDDQPPLPANPKALDTVLQVSLMAGATIIPLCQTMRKIVIDGSNVSGFQRTVLIAVDGAINIGNKKIGIQSLALEEDAARPMSKTETTVTYRLDRLGIPLIELATAPDIATPQEAKQAALAIGELFRRTGNAKRGLGSIRQDLNISIVGGSRVEVKGVQELELIDEYVRREICRQQGLLEIKRKLLDNGISKVELRQPVTDCSAVFSGSDCKFLKDKTVFGICIPQFEGIFGFEVQPNRRFGTEVANYVKTKTGLSGILHSDELPAYGVTAVEVEKVKKHLNCGLSDAFVLVSGENEKCRRALQIVVERCQSALAGVPEETRQAIDGGNTEYLRPLPGASRMYPETDIGPIEISQKKLSELKNNLPLSTEQRLVLYQKNGLSRQLAEQMKLDNFAPFFESQLEKGMNANFMAWILLEALTQLEREKVAIEELTRFKLGQFFEFHKKGKIAKEAALDILRFWCNKPFDSLEKILSQAGAQTLSDSQVEAVIARIVEKNKALVAEKGMAAIGPLMGDAMKELRGKTSGEKISELLKKTIQKRTNPPKFA